MLEIDGVCRALEHTHPWSLADRIADRYVHAIDIVTEPNLSNDELALCISGSLKFLNDNQKFISEALKNQEDMFPGVEAAFVRTVEEVKEIVW